MTSTGLHRFYDAGFGVKPMKNHKPQAVLSTGLAQDSKSPTRTPFSDALCRSRCQNQQGRAAFS
jgi:hypothetical protein